MDTQIYRWVKATERIPDESKTYHCKVKYFHTEDIKDAVIDYDCPFWKIYEENYVIEWLEEITLSKKETPESILALHFGSDLYKIMDAGYGKHIIAAMEEYASQFSTSVPISEPICTCSQELSKDICVHIKDAMKKVYLKVANIYRGQGWDACKKHLLDDINNMPDYVTEPDKETYLSSFLPKKS